MLICEPGDSSHGAHPRVNRTDVETLHPSGTELAKIAQADAAQLAHLPGFSLKKVVGLKDAF
ncbi:hypothetical protein H4582DRAFT_2075887 [Lactarius indigo]|nr:hypothetical protein H4582DRAFT_2075887 [Lactarius indigo]